MRIDLPQCSFKYCRFQLDGNCTANKAKRESCEILQEENKQLEVRNNKFNYWRNICEIQAEQAAKGISKYGYPLEQNTWLDINERLRYLQEELVDALMYIEHIKTLLNKGAK